MSFSLSFLCALVVACLSGARASAATTSALLPDLAAYVDARRAEFDQIPAERKILLEELAQYIAQQRNADKDTHLTFICTHNSRRSHMAQLWAAVAAARYAVPAVHTVSGGTEATAFNPRTVAALRHAGFQITARKPVASSDPEPIAATASLQPVNTRYEVRYADQLEPVVCFSKVYDAEPNPQSDFCAVMTCSHADEECPIVHGAKQRLAVTYEDPKISDDTPEEAAIYDERCAQIAREMLYAMSRVR